jgi:nucleoside-diphosphate-sugar epimerase
MLHGSDEQVWRTNFLGTKHVLEMASRCAPGTPLRHISTAFVAGTRQGRVFEDDSGSVKDFENAYEHSKHEAEKLVRHWAAQGGGRVLIFRPSVLIPPGPRTGPGLPAHTLSKLRQVLDRVPRSGARTVLRVSADPRAHLNLLPVDWAAGAMVHIAENDDTTGLSVLHVVHPTDTPVRTVASVLEEVCQVRIRMVPAMPADPTSSERVLYRRTKGFLPYLHHRRGFDGTRLERRTADLAPSRPVDRPYLRWCFDVQRRNDVEAVMR